jgi:hypothetical protein
VAFFLLLYLTTWDEIRTFYELWIKLSMNFRLSSNQ